MRIISPTVDASTGTIAMRGVVPKPEQVPLPAGFGNVRVSVGTIKHAFLIRHAVLQRDSTGNPCAFAVLGDKAVERHVQTQGKTWRRPDRLTGTGGRRLYRESASITPFYRRISKPRLPTDVLPASRHRAHPGQRLDWELEDDQEQRDGERPGNSR